MPTFNVTVFHFRNPDCLNPEETTTKRALHSLGFTAIADIKMGGCFIITVEDVPNVKVARKIVVNACKKLLVNPVTDHFQIVNVVPV